MSYLVDKLPNYELPVSRNAERAFSIQKVDTDDNPVDFNPGDTVTMWVDIDRTDPTPIEAVIDGSVAAFVIPTSVTSVVKNNTTWQIVLNEDTAIPMLVGTFDRNDGRD